MFDSPTVLAVTLAPMKETLQECGVDFAALARQSGIDPSLLSKPNARYPAARLKKLWQLAADASGDPVFGLHVGNRSRPGVLHALGLGLVSSTSVLKALQRIERYSGVVSTNGRFVLVQKDRVLQLETRAHESTIMPTSHALDAWVATICRTLVQCAGATATPLKVLLPPRPGVAADLYQQILGCPVEFGAPHIVLVFDAERAAQPVFSGNSELAAEADKLSMRYIEGLVPDSASARVRALLLKAMPSGELDQGGIARALNQSASTLHRRLREEGTSYQRLMDSTRRELALEYLQEGRHSLADITFLLGFADQSNFTRAFRRWTGTTPREFLQRGASQSPGPN
jgi:AraC-like DNA-binding protein